MSLINPASSNLAPDSDVDISPHSLVDTKRIDVVPWEADESFPTHRKDLSFLHNVASNVPLIAHQPPSATTPTASPFLKDPTPQYGRHNKPSLLPGNMFRSNSPFGSSFRQPELEQLSPGFAAPPLQHPSPSQDLPQQNSGLLMDDTRRPSAASASTMSSTTSRGSLSRVLGRSHKKLHGFFGEEYAGNNERHDSDASSLTRQTVQTSHTAQTGETGGHDGASSFMQRQGSSAGIRPASPHRPRAPKPSSEVTPWAFQELEVCEPCCGECFPCYSTFSHRAVRSCCRIFYESNDLGQLSCDLEDYPPEESF